VGFGSNFDISFRLLAFSSSTSATNDFTFGYCLANFTASITADSSMMMNDDISWYYSVLDTAGNL
jgi:hypothetical protein